MMVHLYWLDATKPSHNGDCLEGPEKHIFNTTSGNLRPAIQGMQKRGPGSALGIIVHSLFVGVAKTLVTWGKAPPFGNDLILTYLFASTSEKSYMYVTKSICYVYNDRISYVQ